MFAISPLSIDPQTLATFKTVADQGGTAMTESVTNLLPVYLIVGVCGLIIALIFKTIKMPQRTISNFNSIASKAYDIGNRERMRVLPKRSVMNKGKRYVIDDDKPLTSYDSLGEYDRVNNK